MAGTGKLCEANFVKSFKDTVYQHNLTRLHDTTNGFKGIANPCDFIFFNSPYLGYIEVKSCGGKRLPFSNITDNQWNSLILKSTVPNSLGCFFIHFREYGRAFLISASALQNILIEGRKSVTMDECLKYGCEIPIYYIRTRWTLKPGEFVTLFNQLCSKECDSDV